MEKLRAFLKRKNIEISAKRYGIDALGAMAHYVSGYCGKDFQPMNANFGIVDPLGYRVKGGKTAKNEALAKRALDCIDTFAASLAANPAE